MLKGFSFSFSVSKVLVLYLFDLSKCTTLCLFSLNTTSCAVLGSLADIGSEFSLEEIDEKEEMHEENSGTPLSTSTSASNAPLEMGKNETTSLAHDPTIDTVDNVKDSNGSNEEKPENKSADDKYV